MDIPYTHSEWKYSMRRDMQCIIPDLFLGPYSSASKAKLSSLISVGITHIVCVRHPTEARFIHPNFPQHFKYLVLEFADRPTENLLQFIPQVVAFINNALKGGGKVLVHGNVGVSRRDAINLVQKNRPCAMPNKGFLDQLKEYEPIYKAQLMLSNNNESTFHTFGVKRSRSEEDMCDMQLDESCKIFKTSI